MATRLQFENSNEIGCFATLTNSYCVVAPVRDHADVLLHTNMISISKLRCSLSVADFLARLTYPT